MSSVSPPKAINLRVRPLQSVDLCFSVDGILGAQTDIHLLGKPVQAFDPGKLYALLGQVQSPLVWKPASFDPVHGHVTPAGWQPLPASEQPLGWGRLKYDSQAIREYMKDSILFELRAEPVKAMLDKAVLLRENMWVQKYESSVLVATQAAYSRESADAKLQRLAKLADTSNKQYARLKTEYAADFDNSSDNVSFFHGLIKASSTYNRTDAFPVHTSPVPQKPAETIQDWVTGTPNKVASVQEMTSRTRELSYRMPSFENEAQWQRAQISLLDETLAATSATNYANGSKILSDASHVGERGPLSIQHFRNDLSAIDLDIKRLQVAYMDTLLVSPIGGIVTGVFRNVGDSVTAAQAVVRVENDAEIYLVGTIKYRGLIRIGQSLSVTTSLFDAGGKKTVTGKVAAVRGHDSEDERWDLLILCGNRDDAGEPIFPINYNLDFDNTTVAVLP